MSRGVDRNVEAALRSLRLAIFKYPMAVQAAFSALAAEGRRFAETPEGAEWLARLEHAERTGRARLLWDVLSLRSFTERRDAPLPSALVEALSRALSVRHVEPLVTRIFGKGI